MSMDVNNYLAAAWVEQCDHNTRVIIVPIYILCNSID